MKIIVLLAAVCFIRGQRPQGGFGSSSAGGYGGSNTGGFGGSSSGGFAGYGAGGFGGSSAGGFGVSSAGGFGGSGAVEFGGSGAGGFGGSNTGNFAAGPGDQPVAFPPNDQMITLQSGAGGLNDNSNVPNGVIMFLNYCPVPYPVNDKHQKLPCVYPFKMGTGRYNKPQYATFGTTSYGYSYTYSVCATATNLGSIQIKPYHWKYICHCPEDNAGCNPFNGNGNKDCSGCPLRLTCEESQSAGTAIDDIADFVCR